MTNNTNSVPKTRLDYLKAQFDPNSGPFLSLNGIEQLDNSGIIFSPKLCPCTHDPKHLCPCDESFMLFDPKNDGDVHFTNGFTNIPVLIIPTTVKGLDRYIVPFDQFSDQEEGQYHVRIYKNNHSISLQSPGT